MTLETLPNGHFSPASSPSLPPQQLTLHRKEQDLPGGWVVQKFGGTSVGKYAKGIARDIVGAGLEHHRIAIVCSARSSTEKKEGTTNRLLRAAREAEKGESSKYLSIVEIIRQDHIQAARDTIQNEVISKKLVRQVEAECDDLIKTLESAQHLGEVSDRTEDKIVSKGEKLSCCFMTAVLVDSGIPATYVDLSDMLRPGTPPITDRLDEKFYHRVTSSIAAEVLACGDVVPVITGFFGNVPRGLLRMIGRGYTDLCAALVAVGLQATELQVIKEVDGVYTADPRKCPTARLLSSISPSEATELTFYGSEVIHPYTMEHVIRARIPIRVKNVLNPTSCGTVIQPDPVEDVLDSKMLLSETRLFRSRSTSNFRRQHTPKRPTAVTVKPSIIVLNVHSKKRTRAHGFLRNIFSVLDKWRLSVDLIASSEVNVSMALHSDAAMLGGGEDEEISIRDECLLGAVRELREFGTIDLRNNMAIVSLVGKQLHNMVGISGKFLSTLGDNNINIEMISQGASEINISCVIDGRDADRALNVVHTNLFTFLD